MEIENAEIAFIGEIQAPDKGRKSVRIDMKMPNSGGKIQQFIILENTRSSNFDLIKLFERGDHFKVGQIVGFEYNKAREDWQTNSIWKLKIRE